MKLIPFHIEKFYVYFDAVCRYNVVFTFAIDTSRITENSKAKYGREHEHQLQRSPGPSSPRSWGRREVGQGVERKALSATVRSPLAGSPLSPEPGSAVKEALTLHHPKHEKSPGCLQGNPRPHSNWSSEVDLRVNKASVRFFNLFVTYSTREGRK